MAAIKSMMVGVKNDLKVCTVIPPDEVDEGWASHPNLGFPNTIAFLSSFVTR
jgi:hypothetical protein